MTGNKIIKIKIFLASSSELKGDREQFEIFINRKNKEYIQKGIFLELVMWEDFLDAMSPTRLQDEYNKAIAKCDVFVSLFHTKVGQYTEEEFLKALATFQTNQRPLIYTYFKESPILPSQAKQMQSIFDFQEKLSKLGHFYKLYKNIDELKYLFEQQLNKFIPKLTESLDHLLKEEVVSESELLDILKQICPQEDELFWQSAKQVYQDFLLELDTENDLEDEPDDLDDILWQLENFTEEVIVLEFIPRLSAYLLVKYKRKYQVFVQNLQQKIEKSIDQLQITQDGFRQVVMHFS